MAGLAGPALAGRTCFGYHIVNCYHEPLLAQLRHASFSPQCVSSSGNSSKYCRLAVTRCATELGQAASVGLPSSSPAGADAQLASTSGVTWGQIALQGPRPEMEDSVIVRSDGLNGFHYAAVFDGHAGFAAAKFLGEELYRECTGALQNGVLLESSDVSAIEDAITSAFTQADNRLLSRLEETGDELESGSTATVMFLRADRLIVAHVGDSRTVISRAGKAEVVTGDHRPYGNNKSALAEIKRIREAGAWINNGRVCGVLSVSRAFGNIKLKTLRQEMLDDGVRDGTWTSKFATRIAINGDWVTPAPEITHTTVRDAEFIILASDGLWDTLKSSEAVQIVRNQLRQHGNAQRASEFLAKIALDKSGQDNVSIVIADFGKVQQQPDGRFEMQNIGSEVGQAVLTVGIVALGVWLSQFARHNGL